MILQVVRYKVLDKDGNYFNVDAYVKNAVDIDSRNSDGVFCPYKITRSGSIVSLPKVFTVRSYEMNTEDQRMLLFLYLIGLTERR